MSGRAVTITEFLEARIAEDEADARVAEEWADDGPEPYLRWIGEGNDRLVFRLGKAGNHVARWDPARVLAECKAKRAILAMHETCDDVSYGDASTCPETRTLAAVYSTHPDYRQEWAL